MLEERLNSLIRGKGTKLSAHLEEVAFNINVDQTKAKTHCYMLQLDGNGRPKTKALVDFVAERILDYSIPRSQFEKAKKLVIDEDTSSEFIKLQAKARELFTHLSNTGEGGELLLYILTQEFLKIPQLFCKMPLKTSSKMHYHGVDGIHAEYDKSQDVLALYWGESKMYSDINSAMSECFKSLKEYLLHEDGHNSPQQRDLQLAKDGLDLNDPDLEGLLVRYFDKDDSLNNKLQYRGICLIGFDSKKYPTKPNTVATNDVLSEIQKEIDDWKTKLSKKIKSHTNLETFIIHVFLIPFPDVETFRSEFLKALSK